MAFNNKIIVAYDVAFARFNLETCRYGFAQRDFHGIHLLVGWVLCRLLNVLVVIAAPAYGIDGDVAAYTLLCLSVLLGVFDVIFFS